MQQTILKTRSFVINENAEKNGVEITFTAKPSEAVREALKSLKFRWHGVKKLWYGRAAAETVQAAIETAEAGGEKPAEIEAAAVAPAFRSVDRETLRAELSKVWRGDWLENRLKDIAAAVELPNGEIIVFDKKRIEKSFCFGESGFDYEEAQSAARRALTDEDYFIAENMRAWRDLIASLEDSKDLGEVRTGYSIAAIRADSFDRSKELDGSRVRRIEWKRLSEILDDLGGSAFLADIPGKTIHAPHGDIYRVLTAEELELAKAAAEYAAAAHLKRVKTYLKRYGLSNVRSWTYWRDA